MTDLRTMTEAELREAEVPPPDTIEELAAYIDQLTEREHDYGTAVYAMSMAALASFHYVAHKLGVTGFQASCADLDFIGRCRGMKHGFRVVDYKNLLYPQYLTDEHFPSWRELLERDGVGTRLAEEARVQLARENGRVSPAVRAHWEWLVARYGASPPAEPGATP